MKSVNFVILGDTSIAESLGKKGTVSNITLYDRKSSDKIMTFVVPSTFPEKIQPLIQSIMLSEYAILNVKSIDKSLGEQIVALDAMKMEKGFIVGNGLEEDIRKIVKSTVLENYEFVTSDELLQKIGNVEPIKSEGKTKVVVDASFDVKGVGTVVLGIVRRGVLKKHDELEVFPKKKIISVRSIQMHDDDVESADSPGRVGMAIKGASAEEIERGDVAGEKGSLNTANELKIKFEKSKFYKGEISQTSSYHLCVGLQIRPVKIVSMTGDLSIISEKPFAFEAGEQSFLVDLNSESMRIVGRGTIV